MLRPVPLRADATAFALVYHDHHQALYRYCRRILRDDEDAQDALQSTMERAFAALQREQREIDMRPWLFRIAHNEAISILRRRRPAIALSDATALEAGVDVLVVQREEWRALHADLHALSERQRSALVLRELGGLGHAEIATTLDCSPAVAKVAVSEARRALLVAREGREMACADVRRALGAGDRRRWRGRAVRAHLRACAGCREFRNGLSTPARGLRAAGAPLFPGGVALLRQLAAGASGACSGLAGAVVELAGVKALAAIAALAVAAGGASVATHEHVSGSGPATTGPARPAGVPARAQPLATPAGGNDARQRSRTSAPAGTGSARAPSSTPPTGEPGPASEPTPSRSGADAPEPAGEPTTPRGGRADMLEPAHEPAALRAGALAGAGPERETSSSDQTGGRRSPPGSPPQEARAPALRAANRPSPRPPSAPARRGPQPGSAAPRRVITPPASSPGVAPPHPFTSSGQRPPGAPAGEPPTAQPQDHAPHADAAPAPPTADHPPDGPPAAAGPRVPAPGPSSPHPNGDAPALPSPGPRG